ncbi:MAG: succinic semialdehyde dehydrogenase [marine benthic group bacterium]|nr:succinic semialdehyde dehydrogenase [Gemmatimonadota bacterium]
MQEIRAPFTGEVLAHLPALSANEVEAAVGRARVASEAWRATPSPRRAKILERFQDLVLEGQDEILDIVQLETGKARAHAFEEVVDVAVTAAYYVNRAPGLLQPRRRRGVIPGLTRVTELRRPRGVVGIIAPWNYPLSLGATDAIPALLAGNAVVLKPDLQTTHTALWISEKLSESGLPDDLFQVVSGSGPEAGAALVEHADYLSFTGSTATGRIVAAAAGGTLTGASLELGGKNAMIVRGDADLDKAVEGALQGCFANAGQLCISIERIYVHRSIHDRFLSRFTQRTAALRLGTGLDWGYDVGSLSSAAQLEKVSELVDDAVARGVTIRTGGRPRPEVGPWYYEPTVLTGVTPEMRVHSEETFGPVAAVRPFESDDEAVSLANDSPYGLNASVWSRDSEAAFGLASRIEAGTVNINEAYAAAWGSVDAPMGGMKDSGLGRRHGREGLLKYTQTQTIAEQRGASISEAIAWARRPGGRRVTTALLRSLRGFPGSR